MSRVRHTRGARRRAMSEINVVPYIDVMLVLLVIFMVTAPLLTQGVKVDLPNADAEPVDSPPNVDTLVVSMDAVGRYYVNLGTDPDTPVNAQALLTKVAAILRQNPAVPVAVKGDRSVTYGEIMQLMVLLQKAGAPSVGLITDSREEPAG